MKKRNILIIFGISFISTMILKEITILKPLFYYLIAVHESCHAIFSIATGGSVEFIDLNDAGGTTGTRGGIFPIISMGGYIGTTVVGTVFILASKKESYADITLLIFSLTMVILYLLFSKDYFSLFTISTITISILLILSIFLKFTRYLVLIFGSMFIFDSFSDAKIYLLSKFIGDGDLIYQTDAGILARYIGVEILALPIAFIIFGINMFIVYMLIKHLSKAEKRENKLMSSVEILKRD